MKLGSWGEGSAVRVSGWMVCVVVAISAVEEAARVRSMEERI